MRENVLQFSGGKDSLACLYLLKPYWDNLTVMWCNTGAAYPETLELMAKIRGMVPHFEEVSGRQPHFISELGYPVDVLPIRNTRFGQYVHGTDERKFTDYLTCCNANIWEPLQQACKGYKAIYRGQRLEDAKKSQIRSGEVIDGQKYLFPIEDWTSEQVMDFLRGKIPEYLPEYYDEEKSSHDCWNCTAYLEDNATRIARLPARKKRVVMEVLRDYRSALDKDRAYLDEVCNGVSLHK